MISHAHVVSVHHVTVSQEANVSTDHWLTSDFLQPAVLTDGAAAGIDVLDCYKPLH